MYPCQQNCQPPVKITTTNKTLTNNTKTCTQTCSPCPETKSHSSGSHTGKYWYCCLHSLKLFQNFYEHLKLTIQLHACCLFQPTFGCCAHLKAGRNTFLGGRFQPVCYVSTNFRVRTAPKSWLKYTTHAFCVVVHFLWLFPFRIC